MDRAGAAGSSAGGRAVVVTVEGGAPRVTWTGAVAAAAPPAGALVAPVIAAAAAPPAWTRLSARLALAAALFLLGCAAAGLAFFAIIVPPNGNKACAAPADAEVESYLRTASEHLLLAASAQVLAATMALLVPAPPVAFFGCVLGWLTAYRARIVLWALVVACHGGVHGALAFHYWLFYAVLWVAVLAAGVVSIGAP